ncbi:MAG TPA: ABC transporter ATP-binding protein [Acetobacteraceae bacterium]|nr:ABC transporter ATP-binding protein [Acetobacteraceae bacterium]
MADVATSVGIRLAHVSARFNDGHREVTAVRDIDLDVRPGELMTLLGPSGCGKTTTLRMVAGFQEPSSGEILIGDLDVTRIPANRRDIGFVFQNYALFPHLTIFENVAYGLRVRRLRDADIQTSVGAVLDLVGLSGFEKRQPNELSGGQQQRVALARAIVIRPRVLLFDEPLSNLDAKLRVEMRSEIRNLQKTLGITTLYVTHDQEEAMAISDRIAVMQDGAIAQIGTASDLYRRPASVFVAGFIGRANILRGTATGYDGGYVTLSIAGQTARFLSAAPYAPARRLCAVIRPETISLRSDGEGLRARLEHCVYLGDKIEYAVRLGDDLVHVVRSNPSESDELEVGQDVGIALPVDSVPLFPDDRI